MANEQETISDIIAEKRSEADHIRNNLSSVPVRQWDQQAEIKSLEAEANRLEAALRREREASGDCAKLREALEAINCIDTRGLKRLLYELVEADIFDGGLINKTIAAVERTRRALAAPARNCDVGTAKEQESRWKTNCGYGIPNCKHCKVYEEAKNSGLVNGRYLMRCDCRFIWAQMPYEEGGDK